MYIHIYIRFYTQICVYIYTHIYKKDFILIQMYIGIYVYVHTYKRFYPYTQMYTGIYVYIPPPSPYIKYFILTDTHTDIIRIWKEIMEKAQMGLMFPGISEYLAPGKELLQLQGDV